MCLSTREKLYQKGLKDIEIAKEEGVSRQAIFDWRQRNGLRSNNITDRDYAEGILTANLTTVKKLISEEKGSNYIAKYFNCSNDSTEYALKQLGLKAVKVNNMDLRYKNYKKGLTDKEIGELEGIKSSSIQCWRSINGLKPNSYYRLDERMEMYKQGATDKELSYKLGVSAEAIQQWRHVRGLPSGLVKRLEKRLELYNNGITDNSLSVIDDVKVEAIKNWRIKNGLKENK